MKKQYWWQIAALVLSAGLMVAFSNVWLYYAMGIVHALLLTTTIGKWIVEERERRWQNWLRETTDTAIAGVEHDVRV